MATKVKRNVRLSVLQIGYYTSLLETRSSILERDGYKVTSALGNKAGMAATKDRFDVIVVGFSGPLSDRMQMVRWLKEQVPSTPVIALLANTGEKFADADLVTSSDDPRDLLTTLRRACAKK